MKVDVRVKGVEGTPELRSYIERRLAFALGRLGVHVKRVAVSVEDVNGARGGVDKRCVVVVVAPGIPEQVTRATESTLHSAIDKCCGVAARMLSRTLDRRREPRVLARVPLRSVFVQ